MSSENLADYDEYNTDIYIDDIVIDDPEILKILCNALKRNCDEYKDDYTDAFDQYSYIVGLTVTFDEGLLFSQIEDGTAMATPHLSIYKCHYDGMIHSSELHNIVSSYYYDTE